MDQVIEFAQRVLHTRVDLWMVIAGALALAWVDRTAAANVQRKYDAWWFKNLSRKDVTKA